MRTYIITLAHDRGKTKIRTVATSQKDAINAIMQAENCPRRAITKITELQQ